MTEPLRPGEVPPMSDALPLEKMLTSEGTAVLWAINRYLFHPRGYALALTIEDNGTCSGWSVMGNGREVWSMGEDMDDRGFEVFEAFLKIVAETNGDNG